MKFEDFLARELERPEFKKWWDEYGPGFDAGNLLIALRYDLDLTQQQLADRAGVKRSYIARIENGDANPTVKSLARIVVAAGRRLRLTAEEVTPVATIVHDPRPEERWRPNASPQLPAKPGPRPRARVVP